MSTHSKFIFINIDNNFKESSPSDSIKYESYKTANFELTDVLLGKISNAIYQSLGPVDADKFVLTGPNGKFDSSLINGSAITGIDHALTSNRDLPDAHTQYLLLDGTRAMAGILNMAGFSISNVPNPTSNLDAVNKQFLNSSLSYGRVLAAVMAASTANIDLSSMPPTVDSYPLQLGDFFLVKDQANATQNGIYVYNGLGNAATRSPLFDNFSLSQVYNNSLCFIKNGTVNAGLLFYLSSLGSSTNGLHLIGTDNLDWTEYKVTPSLIAGDGIAISGSTISATLFPNLGLQFIGGQIAIKVSDINGVGLIANSNKLDVNFALSSGTPLINQVYQALDLHNIGGATIIGANPATISQSSSTNVQGILNDLSTSIASINSFDPASQAKLASIEWGAEVNQTDAEIKAQYLANPNTNNFDDAAVAKLAGIEAGAEVNPTPAEIKIEYESNPNTNAFTDADRLKLDSVQAGAEVNPPIATQLEAQAGTNNTDMMTPLRVLQSIQANVNSAVTSVNGQTGAVNLDTDDVPQGFNNLYLTNAEKTKLTGIEAGAEVNPTPAEIKIEYESNPNTNAFTDADRLKLDSVQAGAEVNPPIATKLEAEAGVNNTDMMTPLRVNEAIQVLAPVTSVNTLTGAVSLDSDAVPQGTSNLYLSVAEQTKLTGIEAGAEVNQTDAEIKAQYLANPDTNNFDDAAMAKLAGIEAGAEVNQTDAEIKAQYLANPDTNNFDDSAKQKLGDLSLLPIPEWTGVTIYNLNSQVLAPDLNFYRSTAAHLSSMTFATDFAAGYWVQFSSTSVGNAPPLSDWRPGFIYAVDSIILVNYQGQIRIFICIVGGVTSVNFTAEYAAGVWQEVSPISFELGWLSNSYYKIGYVVVVNNITYFCIVDHTSSATFSADSANWVQLSGGLSPWTPATSYTAGTVVIQDLMIYQASTTHVSAATWPADMANWVQVSNPTSFQSNIGYLAGSLIIYQNSFYSANANFTSGAVINLSDWTPVGGQLSYKFPIPNNVAVPSNVTGVTYDSLNTTRVKLDCMIIRKSDVEERVTSFQLLIWWDGAAWQQKRVNYSYNLIDGVTFTVTTTGTVGQLQYISDLMLGVYDTNLSNFDYSVSVKT